MPQCDMTLVRNDNSRFSTDFEFDGRDTTLDKDFAEEKVTMLLLLHKMNQ